MTTTDADLIIAYFAEPQRCDPSPALLEAMRRWTAAHEPATGEEGAADEPWADEAPEVGVEPTGAGTRSQLANAAQEIETLRERLTRREAQITALHENNRRLLKEREVALNDGVVWKQHAQRDAKAVDELRAELLELRESVNWWRQEVAYGQREITELRAQLAAQPSPRGDGSPEGEWEPTEEQRDGMAKAIRLASGLMWTADFIKLVSSAALKYAHTLHLSDEQSMREMREEVENWRKSAEHAEGIIDMRNATIADLRAVLASRTSEPRRMAGNTYNHRRNQ